MYLQTAVRLGLRRHSFRATTASRSFLIGLPFRRIFLPTKRCSLREGWDEAANAGVA